MVFDKYVLVQAIDMFINLLKIMVIARIFLSLIIRDLRNPLLNFIYRFTEPILAPFRNLINRLGINTGMFDFSPLLAFLFLDIVSGVIIRLLY
ncbi:YggT family protein [Clostridium sp. D2Q-14]|uniref:YggT family protein n=1 Tax=Anaeromonas gelatinilytica TaxID=2683194 RepID=UPI00193B52E3|nr:YggT family protein [Anaeromonas gelatinilytica]